MTETNDRIEMNEVAANLEERLERVEKDLDIMERHATELDATEEGLNNYMKKMDREHTDSRFHSVPRPRNHVI